MKRKIGAVLALSSLAFWASCRREEQPPPPQPLDPARQAAVDKCASGIDKAVAATTLDDALRHYYQECADLYTKAPCRDAWRAAAAADPRDQQMAIADACRKAYCPDLSTTPLDLCGKDFPLSGPRFEGAWAQFFGTVLEREGGQSLTPSLLALLVRLAALKGQSGGRDGAAAQPVASGAPSAAPVAAPSSSVSAPAGSAPAPSAASSSAKPKAAPLGASKNARKSH